ncbi:MAG: DUF1080 domain-containing protein [Akkermansiaceae bacterium]|nr:DUF1080 domain-containing protein [Akkermansiaceae bacterium]
MKTITIMAAMVAMAGVAVAEEGKWETLFNGKDLAGWTPKIRGCEAGDNFQNTFRVKDGILKVDYSDYKVWDNRFGHLFYAKKYSHYRLRVEYRFVGEQLTGGPGWALRNSGIMIHSESPQMMELGQEFPASLEVQLLGGTGQGERTTANLCTPGTHVEYAGKLDTRHCITAKSKTFNGEQWVTVEVEVHGHDLIKHFVNGEEVITYGKPVLGGDAHADTLAKVAGTKRISEGYICLQSESHPVEFRKVEIQVLKP